MLSEIDFEVFFQDQITVLSVRAGRVRLSVSLIFSLFPGLFLLSSRAEVPSNFPAV